MQHLNSEVNSNSIQVSYKNDINGVDIGIHLQQFAFLHYIVQLSKLYAVNSSIIKVIDAAANFSTVAFAMKQKTKDLNAVSQYVDGEKETARCWKGQRRANAFSLFNYLLFSCWAGVHSMINPTFCSYPLIDIVCKFSFQLFLALQSSRIFYFTISAENFSHKKLIQTSLACCNHKKK